jgi:hypothetical protein
MEISWQKGANRPHRRFKGSVKGSAALGRFERESDWPSSDDEIHWKSDGDGYVVLGSDPIDIQMLRITSEDTEYFHAIQLTTT